MVVSSQQYTPAALSHGQSTPAALEIWRFCWCLGLETNLLHLNRYEPLYLGYPDCSIPHWWNHPGWSWNFELGQIWTLSEVTWLKYLVRGRGGGCVETGLFSSLLNVVNADCRLVGWKCAMKLSWPIFAWQDWENHEKIQAGIHCCSYNWTFPGVLPPTIMHHAIAQTIAYIQ